MQLTYDYVKRTNKYIMKNFFVFFFFSFVLRLVFVLLLCNSALIKYFCAFTLFFFDSKKRSNTSLAEVECVGVSRFTFKKVGYFKKRLTKEARVVYDHPRLKLLTLNIFNLFFQYLSTYLYYLSSLPSFLSSPS